MWHTLMDWMDYGPPWQVWGVVLLVVGVALFFWWRKERNDRRLAAIQEERHKAKARLYDRVSHLQNEERRLVEQQLCVHEPAIEIVHIKLVMALEELLAVDDDKFYRDWRDQLLTSLGSETHRRH